MGFDVSYIFKVLPKMVSVLGYTVMVILISAVLSFIFSIPVAAIRIKKVPVLSQISDIWLSFIRAMPSILELFIAYFVLPSVLQSFGITTNQWDKTFFVLIALVFHYTPFVSEILRPAYLSVDKGQHEAAASIGLTGFQSVTRIIAPQSLPPAIPQLGNALIDLVKDTSLLYTIGVVDIMGRANIIITDNYGVRKLETYIAVAILYWVITAVVVLLISLVEKQLAKHNLTIGSKK